MDEAGHVLLAIAGIATTLAGFSGLMIAFRRERSKLTIAQSIAVRVLMMTSISAMIFALVPVPFIFGGLRDDILWAALLGLLGVHLLYFSIVVPIDLRGRKVRLSPRFVVFASIHALTGIAMLAGALDVAGMRQPATYMAGLVWLIAVAAAQLLVSIFFVLALLPAPRGEIPKGE